MIFTAVKNKFTIYHLICRVTLHSTRNERHQHHTILNQQYRNYLFTLFSLMLSLLHSLTDTFIWFLRFSFN